MKRILFILSAIIMAQTARGTGICLPDLSGLVASSAITTESSAIDYNRGTWWLAPDVPSRDDTFVARGQAHCSAASVWTDSNFETYGKRCWCRVTDVIASNGYRAPHNGVWVMIYLDDYNACNRTCYTNCAVQIKNTTAIRRIAFTATMDE